MVEEQQTPIETPASTIEDTRQQLAKMYLSFLDKQKGGIVGTVAGIDINLNPLQKDAIEYLTTDKPKNRKKLWDIIGKNIAKTIVEQVGDGTTLEYDKISLAKMKALITQYKDDQTKLQELMAQIEAGKDPTKDVGDDPAKESTNSNTSSPAANTPSVMPVAAGVGGAGAVAVAETTFEKHEVKRNEYQYPLPGAKINSPVGPRTLPKIGYHIHEGIDIATKKGTPILSIADAEIESVGFGGASGFSGYGNYMQVKLKNGYRVLYGHMSKPAQKADGTERKKGDKIKKGEQVGLVGNTGLSQGNHLHLEIREGNFNDSKNYFSRKYLDPIAVLPITKNMVTKNLLARVDQNIFDTGGMQAA